MIQHFGAVENPNDALNISFIDAIKALDISGLLSQCGIRKNSRTIAGESAETRAVPLKFSNFFCLWYFRSVICTVFLVQSVRILRVPKAHTIDFSVTNTTTGAVLLRCLPQRSFVFLKGSLERIDSVLL